MMLPDIRLLQAAIALAEELNFSRAARRLRIEQSTLSKRIQELESELGYLLFARNRQSVELTDAGSGFVELARIALWHVERAVGSGRFAHEDAEAALNVGRSPYTDPFLITTLLSIRLPLFPQLRTQVTQQFSCDLIHDVLVGALDLAIATEPPEVGRLTTVKIAESPLYIAMPEKDELAHKNSVSLDMLAGRPWVLFERRTHPPVYGELMQLADQRKVAPSTLHHVVVPEDAYSFIVDDDAVAFVVKSGAIRIAREGITVRPLNEDALMLKTYIASRADNRSRVVSELVRAFMRKLSVLTRTEPFSTRAPA
jgi:DNA-binding transcriptional LysR family regulator